MIKNLVIVSLFSLNIFALDNAVVQSPNGNLEIHVTNKYDVDTNILSYQIQYKDQIVVELSPIKLLVNDTIIFGEDVRIIDIQENNVNQSYELLYGKTKMVKDHYNEKILLLENGLKNKYQFQLIIRAYDDAIAFRISIPRQKRLKTFTINCEQTFFNLNQAIAYALFLKSFQTPHENNYTVLSLNDIPEDRLIGLPLLLNLKNGPWIAITEANLNNYAGMYLEKNGITGNGLISKLSPLPDQPTVCSINETPFSLPWRVIWVSENPGKFIESNVITSLNEPSKVNNTNWIKPGKVVWPWWSDRTVKGRDFEGGMNTATMMHYIDFAYQVGAQYLLIDAFWYGKHDTPDEDITTPIPEINIQKILSYATKKKVGILLWLNWECARDQMDKAFPLYEKWGVKGIKIDYMNSDDQQIVNFYDKVIELAARHKLIVDFHGCNKPTGRQRTYPNLITCESVLGLEWCKWSDKCNPEHELIIPYTRMLAGPMDFTPGAFNVATRENFKARISEPMTMGTRAHQLAMYVVYYSPLQMLVDYPSSYFGQTGIEFLKAVPTVWDETKFIKGEVGNYIVVARRSGEEWYVGSMTDWKTREIEIPLTFLNNKKYLAHIYVDDEDADKNPSLIKSYFQSFSATDTLKLKLAPGGGGVARFIPTWRP